MRGRAVAVGPTRRRDGTVALLDRRRPQRGWEQAYGVPYALSEAADVLYFERQGAVNSDLDAIDAAILRLFWPWLRRATGRGPIAQETEG